MSLGKEKYSFYRTVKPCSEHIIVAPLFVCFRVNKYAERFKEEDDDEEGIKEGKVRRREDAAIRIDATNKTFEYVAVVVVVD